LPSLLLVCESGGFFISPTPMRVSRGKVYPH
jgi:hypothetical protein